MVETEIDFIAGLDLCESFYFEAIEPILRDRFADLKYSAALIGSGSEVLGFDNQMSSDHHWGPRAMLFIKEEDLGRFGPAIKDTFSVLLPRRFKGYPTNYSDPNPDEHGVQLLRFNDSGPINHRVELLSINRFISEYLGVDLSLPLTAADWLSFPQQKLLSITAGRVFHDDLGLGSVRDTFAYYPQDVWLYLLASSWSRIEQEEHLMGRAGIVGDEIGSAIIGARLVRDLMQLCFLMEKRYAPYPKWFGTAFKQLEASSELLPIMQRVLSAGGWQERQIPLAEAYECVAKRHNRLGITAPMPECASQFHERPFLVISSGIFSKAIACQITDSTLLELSNRPLIGSIDHFSDSTDFLSNTCWRAAIRGLYSPSEGGCF